MLKFSFICLLTILLVTHANITYAQETLPSSIVELRIELDRINLDLKDDAQLDRLTTMINHTATLVSQTPNDASLLLMAGLFNIQYASYSGGLGAIKYAKTARDYLDKSIAIDPSIYGASAHAVLGRMYVSIPGWPIAFGDKKKGLMNFKKALEIAPDSVDANFTYSTYLFENKKYTEAKKHLEKAKLALPRPNRRRVDKKLHEIIDELLMKISDKQT